MDKEYSTMDDLAEPRYFVVHLMQVNCINTGNLSHAMARDRFFYVFFCLPIKLFNGKMEEKRRQTKDEAIWICQDFFQGSKSGETVTGNAGTADCRDRHLYGVCEIISVN
ncbi:MAG: hypothetical protein NC121_14125 [Blautia sp.]|nr:hypothetical protein [Blautia sp.]